MRRVRLSILLATLLTIGLLSAAPASAGTVCAVGNVATFLASDVAGGCPGGANTASEVNSLSVSTNAVGDIVFNDANKPITDGDGGGTGCSVSGNTATCPGTFAYTFNLGAGDDSATVGAVANGGLVSTGGDGNDALHGGPLGDVFDGGPGNDVLDGGGGNDSLHGGDGTDALDGGAGADAVMGGAGDDVEHGGEDNDTLDGGAVAGCIESGGGDQLSGDGGDDALCGGAGPGAGNDNDAISGGDGEDTAFYLRSANVSVSLDNIAADGEAGEADNVGSDVEDVTTGSGNDTLVGNDGRNVLDGGAGADSLSGLGGDDVLMDSGGDKAADRMDGGAGDDTMAAGAGPDVYTGGDGEDAVTDYAGRHVPVTVSLDGNADDGAAGEGDNVAADVEDVTGGSAGDTLAGNSADNELVGGAGDDTISGGDGNDGLDGGAGRDTLDGGAGRDDLRGGAGADTLKTRDGLTDRADCGGGTDAVQGEARDDIAGNCENVSLAKPSALTINSVTVTRGGYSVVKITCPGAERVCGGRIYVKTVRRIAKRFITLGQLVYRLRGAQSHIYKARIAVKDRRPLKRARRVKVRVLVTNVNGDTGDSTSATKLATVTTRGL
jgi:Ca2+-binding RTX toxin-like protein